MLRSTKGFTLIELLIVIVIIGILAAIAIPKFANTKEKAYISAMKSDLRNLAAAEEAYFADNLIYASQLTAAGFEYNDSEGVTVTINAASGLGWGATAAHTGTTKTCGLYYGDSSMSGSAPPATTDGIVKCTP